MATKQVVKNPRLALLDDKGRELVSDVSLTVNAYYPTLGERIQRYLRNPTLQSEIYNNPDLWDDEDLEEVEFNEDGVVISPHEERIQEGLKKAKARKTERDAEAREAARKKAEEDNEAFRRKVQEAVAASQKPKEGSE